ncbi:jacalin-like lectin [Winogradskya humida]|uniref:Jacalin-type lectin domain-containing protein n=1 Tax=Winogradskya humida TaxID=113566 RepID=A0ABQ4A5J9_9ACTN|nr:jacalin-like lectin [Actinoplanes humidus]GIE26113.1 hypothetical protein Ahu01nite_092150 [Actinoplanes humidus]
MRRVLSSVAAVGLTLAATFAVTSSPASAATGTFSVLSYNIAGLPEGLSSAPTPRQSSTTTIGRRIAAYNLVTVQEDFNYHSYLYAEDAHPYRTPTSGGAGIGSGLNTLSGNAYDVDDFERGRWNSCQLDSGDCLTPKGYTFQRVRLAEGVYVDVYNLHTNAGTTSGDQTSRADNLAQLTSVIATHSAGNAVIVMGDTNTRYTRAADTIRGFVSANGLTDAWVQLIRAGSAPAAGSDALVCDPAATTNACETVDKVLYRGSRLVNLSATAFNNEHAKFLETSSGLMLSDHDPVTAGFSWSTNTALQLSDQFGGPHGTYFTDVATVPATGRVTAVALRAGTRVDRIATTLSTGLTYAHGGTGGTESTLTLATGEHLSSLYLCRGSYSDTTRIFYARWTTTLGRTLAGGTTTSDCTTFTAPTGWHITAFHGRAGDELDKLGVVYTRN